MITGYATCQAISPFHAAAVILQIVLVLAWQCFLLA